MDFFLNFKNKSYEALYYESIDTYLSKIVKSCFTIMIVVAPFIPYQIYLLYHFKVASDSVTLRRSVLGSAIFLYFGVVALFIRMKGPMLKRNRVATRWGFDIMFNLMATYIAYQFYDFNIDNPVLLSQYMFGWWECLLVVTVFSPISRWYLKLSAYLIVILRVGIGVYLATHAPGLLLKMFQMVFLEVFLIYFSEKDRRRYFIEKRHLYEETKVYKEIFDLTSDGVIIYGLQEGMLFRNWSNEKHRWWKSDSSVDQNFEKIILKGFKKVSQLPADMELDLDTLVQASNKPNFSEFLKHLTQQLSQNLANKQNLKTPNPLKPGRLMLLTGSVERPQDCRPTSETNLQTTNTCFLLEIKILFTIFKEKPSLALVFSDITERSLVTILQENNNYKNRLLASVSHELRTPLNASINFTQEAVDHPDLSGLPDIKENYLIPALRSSQLLLFLINDILDFSQMSANKLRLVFENKNVYKTLNECLNLIRIQANRKGLKVSVDYIFEKEQNGLFCTDHNRLKQIVLNLLSNSLKFTLEGEIRISARIGTLKSLTSSSALPEMIALKKPSDRIIEGSLMRNDQRILSISISDTGIGISEENRGKLFKAFEKIDLGEKSVLNAQGVGLGLVISNNLVLSLGLGDSSNAIKVESEANKGTTFTFWIIDHQSEGCENKEENHPTARSEDLCSDMKERLTSSDDENMTTLKHSLPMKKLSSVKFERKSLLDLERITNAQIPRISDSETANVPTPSQILIVDDDIFNICALQMILSKLGHTCDAAYNGEQAIRKVLQRHSETLREDLAKPRQYKVIFMDCNMPLMDGFEATKILKTKMKNKEIDPITIVACTAFLAEEDKTRANEIGVDSCCIKPVNKEKVADILRRYLPVKNLKGKPGIFRAKTEFSIPALNSISAKKI